MLLSLGVALALAAAIVWAPAPGGWLEDDPPVGAAGAPAPPAVTSPQSVQASVAAAQVQFALAAATPDATQAAAGLAPPKPAPGPPILVGLTDGSPRRFAYVLNDSQTVRAGLWDKVGKWRVTAIGPHGITLSAGRQSLELALYGPRPTPPPAAAVDAALPAPTAPSAPAQTAAALPPAAPRPHALEPASAPSPGAGEGRHAHYWVGPPDHAPPGYLVLKPGQAPPP
jgi:hypothetical protein